MSTALLKPEQRELFETLLDAVQHRKPVSREALAQAERLAHPLRYARAMDALQAAAKDWEKARYPALTPARVDRERNQREKAERRQARLDKCAECARRFRDEEKRAANESLWATDPGEFYAGVAE